MVQYNVTGSLWAWDSRREERDEAEGDVKAKVSGLMTFLSYLEMYEVRMTYACH